MDTITPDRTFPKENIVEIEIPYELFKYLSKDQCNLDKVCRICLSIHEATLYPLFADSGDEDNVTVNMINAISEVQINEKDGLPRNICENCQRGLIFCYDFKNKCIKSDYTLKSVLRGEFGKIKETETQKHSKIEEVMVEQLDFKSEIKEEDELPQDITDIDYLEDPMDSASDNDFLCNIGERENNNENATVSNQQEYLQENVLQSKAQKKNKKKLKHACSSCPKQRKVQPISVRRELKKIAERERRERMKADPEFYDAVKAKARERYYNRKARGDIIPTSEMSAQEKRIKRLRGRLRTKLYRERKKKLSLQEGLVDCEEKPSIENDSISSPPSEHEIKKFHKVKSLRAHISKHHKESESPFPCDKCKEGFDAEFDLVLHGMLHTPGPNWTCTECHKEFKVRTAFRRHIRRHMQCSRYACEMCGKTFVELCALRRHSRTHSSADDKKFACKHCDKRYKNKWSAAAHEARHNLRRELACACGKRFTTQRLLASHARTHSDVKPYACNHCSQRFRHESTRNIHMRTHTGERPFACVHCDKTFIQRSNMTAHMRTHTGERPYKCTYCDGRFSSGSTLKAHIRTHTGERPFTCKVCGKSFARLNVKLHMRLHTGERPHACSYCPKRFINAARLRDHVRIHTGEKPFECALCSSKFTSKPNLVKHLRSHYSNKLRNGVVMYMPVTVTDESLNETEKPTQYVIIEEPKVNQPIENLPIHVASDDVKTEVLVVDAEQNLITNGIAYVNDLNCTSNVELVTVNEEEMSLTTGNALVEGTTVKVYQYDQSLLQIHSGGGHLTISRISSKMTANLM